MAFLWTWLMEAPDYSERSPLFPNPLVCARDMAKTASSEFVDRMPWGNWEEWLEETWGWMTISAHFDPMMLVWAALICVVLTGVRAALNTLLLVPFAERSKLEKDSTEKLPESIWKFGVYVITWVWSAYILHERDIMFDLSSHWDNWYPGQEVLPTIYWLFTFEIGFYFHYMYGMMFLEQRRKDFVVLMLHHVLTITLIAGCFTMRFHVVGVLLIFIHDIGDVFLEGSKCFNYFKIQDGRPNKCAEMIANIGFLLFAAQYFVFRIYWFVTKALYSTLHVCMVVFPRGPFYIPFNLMLLALLAMQVFWFWLIIQLLVKVLILREGLTDIRDYEEEEDEGGKRLKTNGETKLTKKTNGSVATKKTQ